MGVLGLLGMLLADVIEGSGADLLRGGAFEDLGFISDTRKRMLTFIDSERFLRTLRSNPAISAVIASPTLSLAVPDGMGLAVCEQARLAFARIHNNLCATDFYWRDFPSDVHSSAEIHPSAWIAEKNVRIGPGTKVGPRAVVLERCELSEQCVIGAGVVLGGAGFQTATSGDRLIEMRHAGGLFLGNGVHVLPGAVIATGLFRHFTKIGDDARIGSQAFVSHGVVVGSASFIGHGCVINGNVVVGERAWVGPGVVVANNLHIGDRATVSLGSVVIREVPADAKVSGNFAEPHRALLRRMLSTRSEP